MIRRAMHPTAAMASALLLLFAGEARAQQRTFALDLSTGSDPAPEFVCVLHHGTPLAQDQIRLDPASKQQWLNADQGRSTVTVRADQAPAGVAPETLAGWRAMQPASSGAVCGADQSACVARFDLADEKASHVVCARNAPGPTRNGKVLVVDVRDATETSRAIERVSVEGSVVRFDITGAAVDATLHARVIGGHYRPGPAVLPIGQRFALRPEPRCHTRVIDLPARTVGMTEGRQLHVTVSRQGQVAAQCTRLASSSFAVALAEGDVGAANALRVALRAGPLDAGAAFEATWATAAPPERLVLHPTEISFSWDAPCEYAERVCPSASLPEVGLTCTAEPVPPSDRKGEAPRASGLSCAYRCVPTGGAAWRVAWPAKVAFRAPDPSVGWTAQLDAAGQTLHTYLPDATRSFPVRFAWEDRSEALLSRPGDRIRYVEVTTPKGLTHRIEPRDGQRITLPAARCGDTFDARVVGDRKFADDTARIEDGWLVIPDLRESAHALQVGGMLGGGFILPASRFGLSGPSGLEARAYGTAQLAFRLQPDPHVEGSFFEPRAYELQLSYVIAQQPYFPVHAPDEEMDENAEYLAFNRWALEAMPLWQLGQRTQLGVGMGVGLGFPVRTKDEPAVGKSRLFFIPLTALGRIQITRAVSIEGSFRLVGPEKVYRYEPSPLFAGTPVRTEDTLWSGMLGLVGVRVWL